MAPWPITALTFTAFGLVTFMASTGLAGPAAATLDTLVLAQNDGVAPTWSGSVLGKPITRRRPIYRSVPYLSGAVSPAAAAAMRAVRQYEPRIVREDLGQVVAHDNRYVRAAVRAVARYQRAADQGYVMARYNLARVFAEGRGVKRDYPRAIKNFRIAAMSGNVPALLRLAEFYLAGLGVPEDRVEAQAIYYVAASIESKGASRAKAMLSTHLDNIQLQQARKRARILRAEMPALDLVLQRSKEQDLLAAAAQGDLSLVQDLMKSGVDANAINALGRTPAIAAAWRGHGDVVDLLINSGVEIDAADNQGRTALTWAAINGHPVIINKLLAADALVDVRDTKGLTPLIRAAWNGHEEVVAALIKAEADVNAADDRGITALQRATEQNERKIAARLRAAGAR
jgi:TPR repeat protein